jgi:hypothetical protein
MRKSAFAVLTGALLIIFPATAGPPQKWVQGSWINVRAAADNHAAVLTHWTVNTEVQLLQQSGDWCQAQGPDAPQGYVACKLLGDRMLTLHDVERRAHEENPDADPMRAFWIAPSVARFIEAGTHLNQTLLNEKQQARQNATHQPLRWPVPEFEAMKQRMADGVPLRPDDEIKLLPLSAAAAALDQRDTEQRDAAPVVRELLRQGQLRPPKSSLFTRGGEVMIATQGDIDGVAAVTGQPLKVRVLRGPRWFQGNNDEGIDGFWDVGAISAQLAVPAVLHTVTDDGLVGAALRGAETLEPNGYEGCAGELPGLPNDTSALADYPRLNERPLVAFYLAKPLPSRKVKVLTWALRIADPGADAQQHDGVEKAEQPPPLRVTLNDIDLNGDGIPDIAVWQSEFAGAIDADSEVAWKAYFLNIGGVWFYAGYDEETVCS